MDSYLTKYSMRVARGIQRRFLATKESFALHRLLKIVKPYTMVDELRLIVLYGLAREALSLIQGDILECGVCKGGSAAVLGAAMRDYGNGKLLLFDTFEGIPAPSSIDGPFAPRFAGDFKGSVEAVKEVLSKVRFPEERTLICKGLFHETFKSITPRTLALIHIDADWHESVYSALEKFYPMLAEGGIVILDDFGYWEGAREAVYDYCQRQGIKPLIERVGYWQGFWRKGLEHNRHSNSSNGALCWPPQYHLMGRWPLLFHVAASRAIPGRKHSEVALLPKNTFSTISGPSNTVRE